MLCMSSRVLSFIPLLLALAGLRTLAFADSSLINAQTPADLVPLIRQHHSWPTPDWPVAPRNMNSPECRDFTQYLQKSTRPWTDLQTDGLVVIQGGKLRYEWYDGAYTAQSPHCLWSASKAVASALVGIAIHSGNLSMQDKLSRFYPAAARNSGQPYEAGYADIRVRDLLEMGADFEWNEDNDGDLTGASELPMLYLGGQRDMATYAAHAPMGKDGPGNRWQYNSGATNILMGILQKVYGERLYAAMPWTELFDKLGMRPTVFETDPAGTFVGAAYVHTTPRSLAKLGYLYLNDGIWENHRILPEGWVRMARTLAPPVLAPGTLAEDIRAEGEFSAGFWLNQPIPQKGITAPLPNSPSDLFMAAGHFGQLLIVIPSRDLIIARTGHDREYWSKVDGIVAKSVACFGPGPEATGGRR